MARMVLLEHDLGEGDSHFDWMLQAAPGAALITFRVHHRLDVAMPARFVGDRLADHRAAYLEYEGPVGPAPGSTVGRGVVRRLASGVCEVRPGGSMSGAAGGGGLEVHAHFIGAERVRLRGAPVSRAEAAVVDASAATFANPWLFFL